VRVFGESVILDDVVELAVVAHMESDEGAGPQHRLVLIQLADVGVSDGQRPQEPAQAFDVPALLQRLADGGHLRHAEVQRRQCEHGRRHQRETDCGGRSCRRRCRSATAATASTAAAAAAVSSAQT